ncbi:uncharacterized protein LOC110249366 [Exaiptasia diaphana]|uniref:THAP-type domain-containing protein n=1 Tax=Exaiptasia diaphana TaxID=2652724 RepID=A0A913XZ84_EXADI|nr:uncharacterized protein LOC110249366 [Exaiptasia diaphana]KXJ29292.1 THAP domain-containing protein 2 [Exaiptasia diaphana]
MVHCCVPECTNHSSKTTSVSYHKIPMDVKLRKAWLERLRRDNLPTVENCYVCSDYCDKTCFKLDFREELTGERGKRRLNANAVPSIFAFNSSNRPRQKKRSATEDRTLRKQTLEELLKEPTPTLEAEASTISDDLTDTSYDLSIHESTSRDFSAQCCLESVPFVITKNASTQTDTLNSCIEDQVRNYPSNYLTEIAGHIDASLIKHEHPYAKTETTQEKKLVP